MTEQELREQNARLVRENARLTDRNIELHESLEHERSCKRSLLSAVESLQDAHRFSTRETSAAMRQLRLVQSPGRIAS